MYLIEKYSTNNMIVAIKGYLTIAQHVYHQFIPS